MIISRLPFGSGSGELHGATIVVNTEADEFVGQTVQLISDEEVVASKVFNDTKTLTFDNIQETGDYTVSLEYDGHTFTNERSITSDDIILKNIYTLTLYNTVEVTLAFEGAKEDTITISDKNGDSVGVCVFPSGSTTGTATLNIVDGEEYTFTSSVAKDTTDATNDYSKKATIYASVGDDYSIKTWSRKGHKNYNTLDSIPLDDLKFLMKKHASADYFLEWYEDDNTMLSQFTANENAMKALGESDYLVDKLFEINNAKTSLLESEYWECILKDKVPIMTSNTTPEGTAEATSSYSTSYSPYYAFDSNSNTRWNNNNFSGSEYLRYSFSSPICVNKISLVPYYSGSALLLKTFKIQASNDGITWDDITDVITTMNSSDYIYEGIINNDNYYMKYQILCLTSWDSNQYAFSISDLQFYGRSLNVSVPTMASNTEPYGEVIGDSDDGSSPKYGAFNGGRWSSTGATTSGQHWIGYDFKKSTCVRFMSFKSYKDSNSASTFEFEIQASNDGSTWTTLGESIIFNNTANNTIQTYSIQNDAKYEMYRVLFTKDCTWAYLGQYYYAQSNGLNFYGVDYSDPADVEVMPDGALYWYGNECIDVTGGWIAPRTRKLVNGYTYGSKVGVKTTNYLTNQSTGGSTNLDGFETQNLIEVSQYEQLHSVQRMVGTNVGGICCTIHPNVTPFDIDNTSIYTNHICSSSTIEIVTTSKRSTTYTDGYAVFFEAEGTNRKHELYAMWLD